MTRMLGRYVSLEMAILGLCELGVSFLLIYTMLNARGAFPGLADGSSVVLLGSTNLAAILAFTVAAAAAIIGLYRPEICLDRRRLWVNALAAGLLAFPAVLLVSGSVNIGFSSKTVLWLAKLLVFWVGCILVSRMIFSRVMREKWFVRRLLVLGSTDRAARLCEMARAGRGRLFEPVLLTGEAHAFADPSTAKPGGTDIAPLPLSPANLRSQRIWGIVVADDPTDPRNGTVGGTVPVHSLLDCKLRGVPVFDEAGFCEQHLGRIDPDSIGAERLLYADGFASGIVSACAKRAFDILTSLVLLLLTLPLVLLTALLVKLDSPGPILYRQTRVGLHGRTIMLLKFRSMTADAEAGGNPRWASQQDPRITRVGSFIRPMRIDELPQLLNVLRGEMSMIGPRPERPHFVEQLTRVIPFYRERSYVKPGITGWAQVNFPYGASVEDAREKLAYDLYYVKNHSLLLDMLILLSTVRVILFREGAR